MAAKASRVTLDSFAAGLDIPVEGVRLDMGQAALDEELAEGIRKARKKACNFALICKGPQPVKLIVRKKQILDGELVKSKSEFKGNAVVSGVCLGNGAELEFHVIGDEEPGVKPSKLREFISEQAEITIKPVWKCVTELPVTEDDDEAVPAEANSGAAPPVPPPAPAGPEAKALLGMLNKLSGAIQAAALANPLRRDEIVGQVGRFKQQVAAEEFDAAKSTLKNIGALLKELGAYANAPSPPAESDKSASVQPVGDSLGQRWNAELGALEPRYLEALKKADERLASQMRVVFAFAKEQAEAGAFDRALKGLERLEPLVEQALQGEGSGVAAPTGKVAAAVLRAELNTIRLNAARGLEQLASTLKVKTDPRARQIQPIIEKLAQGMPTDLEDALQQLDAAVKSGNAPAAQSLRAAVQQKAQVWMTFLQTYAHEIRCSENNPWGVAVAIERPVRASLMSILKTTR